MIWSAGYLTRVRIPLGSQNTQQTFSIIFSFWPLVLASWAIFSIYSFFFFKNRSCFSVLMKTNGRLNPTETHSSLAVRNNWGYCFVLMILLLSLPDTDTTFQFHSETRSGQNVSAEKKKSWSDIFFGPKLGFVTFVATLLSGPKMLRSFLSIIVLKMWYNAIKALYHFCGVMAVCGVKRKDTNTIGL